MNRLYLYNTLSKKKEEFKPRKGNNVGFYYCGPTVYWTQHIGNLRGAVCADVVLRTLEFFGYDVTMVRNYTDVGHLVSDQDEGEDKMEKGVKREGLSPEAIAEKYIKIYEDDTHALNIIDPDVRPHATRHIKEMIAMIQILLEKGYAYITERAVYFDTSKVKNYTALSGQIIENNKAGAGTGDVFDHDKKSQIDFALWFFRIGKHAQAIQFWPSPFVSDAVTNGEGFPGWHIECSAMSRKYLGDTLDIHMGGIEHIPVHHTNEIAQSEAATGVKYVNYWLHNEHLMVNGRKMAKSEGTGFSLAEIKEKGFDPLVLRFFFLQAHYRSKQNFTWQALEGAKNGFEHIKNQIRNLGVEKKSNDDAYLQKFKDALGDDFNTPQALAVLQEMLKSGLPRENKLQTALEFDKVLGLKLDNYIGQDNLPRSVKELVFLRNNARNDKNWEQSDKLRMQIEDLGYKVEDCASGMKVIEK